MILKRTSTKRPGPGEMGTVLLPALFVSFLLAGLVGAFARVLLAHTNEAVSAETGAQTFYVAEAGVNAAIAEIEGGVDAAEDGLGTVSGSFAGGAYNVVTTVIVADEEWSIASVGNLRSQTRRLEAVLRAEPTSLFLMALFSNEAPDVSGDVVADSYDSRLGSYASQAINVDPVTGLPYANAEGDIGSNAGVTLSGDVTVFGDATPGPGYSVTMGGGAYVSGSTTPASQPVSLPPVTYVPVGASLGAFSLGGSKTYTFTAGTYHYASFRTSKLAVATCTGTVVLYVDGNFEIGGSSQLVVAPGAQVTIHHGSGYFEISGGGVVNQGRSPEDFIVYSATGAAVGDYVECSGSSDFYGAIYAPNAPLMLTGGSDSYGAFVGRTMEVSGVSEFHYDEALADVPGPGPGVYTLRSWREIGSP